MITAEKAMRNEIENARNFDFSKNLSWIDCLFLPGIQEIIP